LNNDKQISPVLRSKKDARKTYDRISRYYDFTEGLFERKYIKQALEYLQIKKESTVLEIGFGTGNALIKIAEIIGTKGSVYGIDISPKMTALAKEKINKRNLLKRIYLTCGDAVKLPYKSNIFDAVFLSFTLELFDTPEIPIILKEIKRVLRKGGRLGVLSLLKEDHDSRFTRLYEWAHRKFPRLIDCRPIYVSDAIKKAGFKIVYMKKDKIYFVPVETVISINQ
jgi:demethylmenaquinone methyltransferase/2-methoxy-6-polyprenyl-1,4-benzoquinol methylase